MKAIRKVRTEKDLRHLRDLRDPSGMAPNGTWTRSRMASGCGSPAPKTPVRPGSPGSLASLSLGTTTEEMEETRKTREALGRLGDQLDGRCVVRCIMRHSLDEHAVDAVGFPFRRCGCCGCGL